MRSCQAFRQHRHLYKHNDLLLDGLDCDAHGWLVIVFPILYSSNESCSWVRDIHLLSLARV